MLGAAVVGGIILGMIEGLSLAVSRYMAMSEQRKNFKNKKSELFPCY